MLEKQVKTYIKNYLTDLGAYLFMPVQMGYGGRTLDMLVCYKGKFIGIECKRTKGSKLTAIQESIMRKITIAGGIAIVATSCEDVMKVINDIDSWEI